MKKIINRKVYNTETAELIGEYWNGLSINDFHYVYEELYITKKGNYASSGSKGMIPSVRHPGPLQLEYSESCFF